MARRLAIVISQSPRNEPARRELEEELATRLLLERGIDVSLVPHLAHLEPGSTGLLCLEGIKGDVAVAAWLSPDETLRELRRRGIAGRRGSGIGGAPQSNRAVEGDLAELATFGAGPQSQRTIHCLDLHQHAADIHATVRLFLQLRDDTGRQLVEIGLSGPASAAGLSPSKEAVARRDETREIGENPRLDMPVEEASSAAAGHDRSGAATVGDRASDEFAGRNDRADEERRSAAASSSEDDLIEAQLDSLLDEFDGADW